MISAIYSRVSTDGQEREATINSQVAELRARLKQDGISDVLEFTDEGYSRDNLARPDLDRLRDMARNGEIGRLYVQAPDRLACGAGLIILVEELQKSEVEVIFLVGGGDDSPEGKLLLGMQGIIGAYEKVKILERTRRGRDYWARSGYVVSGTAPYGYLHLKTDNDRTTLVVGEEEARIVRQMYAWLIEDQASLRQIAIKLNDRCVPTSRGGSRWLPSTVGKILNNEVYAGILNFRRTEAVEPKTRHEYRAYRKYSKTGRRIRSNEDWIAIPVPAIIARDTWDRAQQQLQANSGRAKRNCRRQYLLRSLLVCGKCGSRYYGVTNSGYRYYRCGNRYGYGVELGETCKGHIRADAVEEVVWAAMSDAIRHPEVIADDYQRRLEESGEPEHITGETLRINAELKRLKAQEDRLVDAYRESVIDMDRFRDEVAKVRARATALDKERQSLQRRELDRARIASNLERLERFAAYLGHGLDSLTFEEKHQLMTILIDRIVIEGSKVRIEAAVKLPEAEAFCNLRPLLPRRGEAGY
jgi:site-specific DNA recombinase